MAITRMTVIKASSDADYRKGQGYFFGSISALKTLKRILTLTDAPMITATVLDADGSEHETRYPSMKMKPDCRQLMFLLRFLPIRAALLPLRRYSFEIYLQTTYSNEAFRQKKQNRIGQTLIESYIHQSSGSHYPAEASETKVLIELEPILHKQYHKLSVDFKIGTGKKYVIKDFAGVLPALFIKANYFNMEKESEIFHEPEAFHF